MADMFSTYEEEFLGLKKMIHDFIDSIPSATGEGRKREIGDAKDLVEQAKDLVKNNNNSNNNNNKHTLKKKFFF